MLLTYWLDECLSFGLVVMTLGDAIEQPDVSNIRCIYMLNGVINNFSYL